MLPFTERDALQAKSAPSVEAPWNFRRGRSSNPPVTASNIEGSDVITGPRKGSFATFKSR